MTTTIDTIAPVDLLVQAVVTKRTSPLGSTSPDTGRSDVTISYSDAEGGDPIDTTLSKSAAETSTLGTYQAAFLGTDLVNFLPDREGSRIYECVWLGSILYKITPLLVVRAP
jgi:hypothetical protein